MAHPGYELFLALKKELVDVKNELSEALFDLRKQKEHVQILKNVINDEEVKIAKLLEQNIELRENRNSQSGSRMRTAGRFRQIESSPVYEEFLWEIDDACRLLDKKEEFLSPLIIFRGHEGKMTFGFVDDDMLIRLRMDVEESLYWSAGIVLADGTEYFTGSGQVSRSRSYWTAFGSWVGPSKSMIERCGLIPEDVLTLSVRISLLPASGGDMSLKTEVAVNENRNKGFKEWKPTKDDLKVIQQYKQFLRSEEDRQHILLVRREEAQAKIREQLRSSKYDDDDIHDLRAA